MHDLPNTTMSDNATSTTITIGIAGLTGKISRRVARNLLARPNVHIRGLARDPSKVPEDIASNPRVDEIIKGEALDRDAAQRFAKGCDAVLCAYLGRDVELMIDGQKVLIDACEAAGVPRYFASDFTLDYTKLEPGQLPMKDPMIAVKKYIEDRQERGSKVQGVYVLISGFMETIFSTYFQLYFGPPENRIQSWTAPEDKVWELTSYKTTAEYTAELLMDRDAVGVKKFLGETVSARDIADTLNKVYGTEPTIQQLGSLDQLYEKMHALQREEAGVWAYIAMFYQYYLTNGQTWLGPIDTLDNAKYPAVKAESLEDFFRRVGSLEELNGFMFRAAD